MLITSILIILVVAITYLVVLPLRKRRPVMIKNSGFAIFLFAISMIAFLGDKILPFLAILLIGFFLIFKKQWFIYGITSGQIVEALQKAATATRTVSTKLNGKFNLDSNNAKIKISNWSNKINFVSFSFSNKSRKAILAIEVFRKFILNYFLE